ncbi:MAG: hypothetical protein LBN42_02040 [Oscillospiraceae bacterium]|jgi:YbbR domain-containing protein|nr:hypothetical protein [Oscillospiraceae bacterium]
MNKIKQVGTYLIKNLMALVLSFAIAVAVWVAVSLNIFPDVTRHITNVPVSVPAPTTTMQSNNLKLSALSVKSANVDIIGKRYDIGALTSDELVTEPDLSDILQPGNHTVPLIVKYVDSAKKDKELTLQSKTYIDVTIIKITSKTLDILPDTEHLKAANGFVINAARTVVAPASVTISGNEELINSIKKVIAVPSAGTEPLSENVDLSAKLEYYGANNSLIADTTGLSVNAQYFLVNVTVAPETVTRSYPVNIDINPPQGFSNFNSTSLTWRIKAEPSEILISGPKADIDNFSIAFPPVSLTEITYPNLKNGLTYNIKSIELPEGYENVSGYDTISLKFENTSDYVSNPIYLTADNISIGSSPKNIIATIPSQKILVNVVGPVTDAMLLTPDDISLTVNLSGGDYSEGMVTLNAAYKINGVSVPCWLDGIPKVKVNLKLI